MLCMGLDGLFVWICVELGFGADFLGLYLGKVLKTGEKKGF